jgi:hypothetical protein
VIAPHLRTVVSAEMARGRLGRTRRVEGAEENDSAFVSCLTAFSTPLLLLNGDLPWGLASLGDPKKVPEVAQVASTVITGLVPLFRTGFNS